MNLRAKHHSKPEIKDPREGIGECDSKKIWDWNGRVSCGTELGRVWVARDVERVWGGRDVECVWEGREVESVRGGGRMRLRRKRGGER